VVAKIDVTEMLRAGLLTGVSLIVARAAEASTAPRAGLSATVASACTELGASVFECELSASGSLEADDAATANAVAAALAELGEVSLLLVDAASSFALARGTSSTSADGSTSADVDASALVDALEASWRITQTVANAAFIERGAAGRILYIAPPPDAGTHADAARAGLENLARTLSIEWARYGITPLAIAPRTETSAAEIAALTAYLASPAGDYFSGCLLDLRGPGAAGPSIPGR
jgi:NAD(P)-dependent dehydrogenase (short-subunit alcohol dehydrogenase family)